MLKFTETVEIINFEYSIEIYGYDPNWMDVPATLITHQQFQSTKVPFTVKIKIPKNAADSIEHINNKANAKYYLNMNGILMAMVKNVMVISLLILILNFLK